MSGSFPNPVYARRVLSPNFDQAKNYLVPAMYAASRAQAVMLVKQGILDRDQARSVLAAFDQLEKDGIEDVLYDGRYEDLFFYIESRLAQAAGEEAMGNLQIARSRNDLDGMMCRWVVREKLLAWMQQAHALRRRVILLCQEHINTLMPGYTHTQPAQPTTLAHYFCAVTSFLERDDERMRQLFQHVNYSSLGAVAFTTTGFPIDREITAHLTGFAGPLPSSYDAVGGADYQAETAAVVQIASASRSRLLTDLLFYATQEAGALRIADEFLQISSIMPQKRNPVVLEHIRTQLGYLYGDAQAVFTLQRNSPLGDVNDVEDPIYRPLFRLLEYMIGVDELIEAVLASAEWNVQRLAARAGDGFSTATELADTLVREAKLPFRTAHRVVATLVRDAQQNGVLPVQIGAAELDRAAQKALGHPLGLSEAVVRQALDARHFVEIRSVLGGPAPQTVAKLLAQQEQKLAADELWMEEQKAALLAAQAKLRQEIEAL